MGLAVVWTGHSRFLPANSREVRAELTRREDTRDIVGHGVAGAKALAHRVRGDVRTHAQTPATGPAMKLTSRVGILATAMTLIGVHTIRAQAASSQPSASSRGVIAVVNATRDSVRVEVRIGPSTTCEANPALPVRRLRRGATWRVRTTQSVCYRVQPADGSASTWSTWVRRVPLPGRVAADSL